MWKIFYLIFFVFVINNIDLKKKIYMKELRLVMLILKKIDWLIDWFYEWIDGYYINIFYCMEYNLWSNSFVKGMW